jgi:aconitate hydratase
MGSVFNGERGNEVLEKKRKLLGRGLSYAEKILALHETPETAKMALARGADQVQLYPDRVALQDATAQMAILQFMQSGKNRACVQASIHCDHLIRAREGSAKDLERARSENKEVYAFLASAARKYGIDFWGPGSGIIHQVVFENYGVPGGLMLGTDSHTPNAGGLGMIAIGVGGAEAAEVMAGLQWEPTSPYLVGVKLTGALKGWASAKDVILDMLMRFTVKGGTGRIFEYFGSGAQSLSATQKATITNMGAELGATASVFVYDDSMDAYLRNVGRLDDADRAKACADLLCQDEICCADPESVFDEIIEIGLGQIEAAHAGPFSPDKITAVSDFRSFVKEENLPQQVSAVLVGSCTNSSYADLAGVAEVLEQGTKHSLKTRVPFFLSPGSARVYETIKRDGILDKIVEAGATILTASCGPCIGQWDREDVKKGVPNCLFNTFNRNFRGRNDANPETRGFLTSPVLAAALALAGDVGFDPESNTLTGQDGSTFKLQPPHPPALPVNGLADATGTFSPPAEDGALVEVAVDPDSERIELLKSFDSWDGKDFLRLPVLAKTKGKTTTDHISPGGKWLQYRGHLTNISRNLLDGALNAFTGETGHGTNVLTGECNVAFSELAEQYKENVGGSVVIGDDNYGEGSSREHAAMSPRFLGVKAVISRSFARIHEANLKKQGILPLTFADPQDYEKIEEFDRVSIVRLALLKPRAPLKGIVTKKEGSAVEIVLNHTLTDTHLKWFKAGSALNLVRVS